MTDTHASISFHGELNDFVSSSKRNQPIAASFRGRASVKDVIENLGVPHPEIGLIVANGESVDFSYLVGADDRIDVYSRHGAPDVLSLVRPPRLDEARFVLDAHLGKLAKDLRMLGFDTLYRNDYDDAELARISSEEKRILLSRDLGLLKRGIVRYGRFVRATDPWQQVSEVLRVFELFDAIRPFQRCMRCNGLLQPVDKATILDRLELKTRLYYNEFRTCPVCGAIYWQGSHYQHMQQLIAQIGAGRDV